MAEQHPNIREALLEMAKAWTKRAEAAEKEQKDGK
jgi:hypothetical protein